MMQEVERLAAALQLVPHPEGGWYRETYRSQASVSTPDGRLRSALTNIYFLLTVETFSAWHRIDADETWHFYRGGDLVVSIIRPDGVLEERRIGPDGPWQTTVPAGSYFAAHVHESAAYALVGCSVAPGFDFSGFELGSRDALIAKYPQHTSEILRFTRE
ncbi:MAG TPA: cupin domain-containing protein [Candidatus Baltobacteraceae bacterium]|nr:cupin domain-containing protein [Candidatus Baltobacteraceae bacterium]